jgi:hypothetical protein
MPEVHIGRLVAASLHQAIGEELPQRIDFYETWLDPDGLRDGNIGVAPMLAILGFLRTEGEGYERVVARAGELSAEWALASFSPVRQRMMGWLPRRLRIRTALRVAGEIAVEADSRSRLVARVRGRTARIEVPGSVFCSVRGTQTFPLCGYYRALAVRTLAHFGLPAAARVDTCRAMGAAACVIEVTLGEVQPMIETAVAA